MKAFNLMTKACPKATFGISLYSYPGWDNYLNLQGVPFIYNSGTGPWQIDRDYWI